MFAAAPTSRSTKHVLRIARVPAIDGESSSLANFRLDGLLKRYFSTLVGRRAQGMDCTATDHPASPDLTNCP
jgi:hypothetical protein